jgi:biotin carboxylase
LLRRTDRSAVGKFLIVKHVLLLLPVASYRNEDFLAAARKLDVEVIPVADNCPQLAPGWGMGALAAVHFDQPLQAAQTILDHLPAEPDAVLAVDDHGLELAALLRERLGLAGNAVAAVGLTRDKLAFRHLLQAHGFRCPNFQAVADDADLPTVARSINYPAVVKARRLSSSRGVVRADNAGEFITAVRWVRAIQARADRESAELGLIVEAFIPGQEYALEGLLTAGELKVLALFDKPDPLDGPYFEETIYVTPSRLPQSMQALIVEQVARACRLAGLSTGPVHAEMRVNQHGVWLLEVAARSIGGLCGRMLNHALGMSLEEVVLRHALGEPVPDVAARDAAAVMMIPIPKRGIYQRVHHLDAARAVPHISHIQITAEPGALLLPAPEGASYLGFIFAQAESPQAAEQALREAQRLLRFDIETEVPLVSVY